MKLFKAFRLDMENHILLRNGDRVPIAPKVLTCWPIWSSMRGVS